MDVCSGGHGANSHDEIVFNSRSCPVCVLRDELAEITKELESTITELQEYKDSSEDYYSLLEEYAPEAIV